MKCPFSFPFFPLDEEKENENRGGERGFDGETVRKGTEGGKEGRRETEGNEERQMGGGLDVF